MVWMLTCQDVASRADDRVDDRLAWRDRLKVDLHLLTCPRCRRAIAQLRAVVGLLRARGREVTPPELEARIVDEVLRRADRGGPGGPDDPS